MEQKELRKLTELEKQKIKYVINDLLYEDILEEPTEYDVLMRKKNIEFSNDLCKDNDPYEIEGLMEMCNEYINDNVSFAGSGFGIIVMYDMWINECSFWPTNNPKLWKEWDKLKKKKVNKSDIMSSKITNEEVYSKIKTIYNSEDIIHNKAWITPKGHIFGVPSSHIITIVEDPGLFCLSNEKIKVIFDRHGEYLGSDGNASDEILSLLTQKSWIIINFSQEKSSYKIELDNNDDIHKEYLSIWASEVINKHPDRANCQVMINEKIGNSLETTLTKLLKNGTN